MSELIIDCWIHVCRYKVEREKLIKYLKEQIRETNNLLNPYHYPPLKTEERDRLEKNLKDLEKFLHFAEQKPQNYLFCNRVSKVILSV